MSTVRSAITPTKSSVRVILVVLLGLASIIPLGIVDGVATERRGYFDQARHEVADSWGLPQVLTGPVLVVPVDYVPTEPVGGWARNAQATRAQNQIVRKHVVLLPDELVIDGAVDYELRERAIYQIALFAAEVHISGAFANPRARVEEYLSSLGSNKGLVDFSGAKLVIGISDPRAIRLGTTKNGATRPQSMMWGDSTGVLEAGSLQAIIGASVQVPVTIKAASEANETTPVLSLIHI